MKKIDFLIMFVLCIFATSAQSTLGTKSFQPATPTVTYQIHGAAPTTAFLLIDLEKMKNGEIKMNDLAKKWSLVNKGGTYYVNSFVKALPQFNASDYGALKGSVTENMTTLLIPIKQLAHLASDSNIIYIEVGDQCSLTLDNAKIDTDVSNAHAGTGGLSRSYFGDNVIVGIIDIGFNYTHPAFYSDASLSDYRVLRVWEQRAESGTPPSGYGYGRELVGTSAILGAIRDIPNQSHGTHVASTVAGSGVGSDDNEYRGVAPNSEYVLVSTTLQRADIGDAVNYIFDYAETQNKPCVINISIGGHYGPHDGTSSFDRLCDDVVGAGKVIVGSAGNDGTTPLYLEKDFSNSDTVVYTFVTFPESNNNNNGSTTIDIWGEEDENFKVAINLYNVDTEEFIDYTPYTNSNDNTYESYTLEDDDFWAEECEVAFWSGIDDVNNKPRVTVQIDNSDQSDDNIWVLVEIIGYNTTTKMWATGNGAYFIDNNISDVTEGSTNSTVSEVGGIGNNIISVGAHCTKRSWTDLSGSSWAYNESYAMMNDIAPFSSRGPTADGRTKPDISAPGLGIVAAVSSYDNDHYPTNGQITIDECTFNGDTWYFGIMQGTSMSSPMVTGIVALWLGANPALTNLEVAELLKETAETDSYTGIIPETGSNTWGWGKVNALNGLLTLDIPIEGDYTLNFNINYTGGINPESIIVTAGEAIGTLPFPSQEGHTFLNWKINNQNIDETTIWNYPSEQTAVAQWSANNYTLILDPNGGTVDPTVIATTFGEPIGTLPTPTRGFYTFEGWKIGETTLNTNTLWEYLSFQTAVAQWGGNVGVEDYSILDWNIHPNPAQNTITIEGISASSVTIIDLTGKTVLTKNNSQKIDISHLTNGIYILQISDEKGGFYRKKIVKN